MTEHQTDMVVIGAGPVGLFTVFEAGMLKMQCHVVDTLDFIGGQCTALYPEKPIYDIPGYPKIDAADLIESLAAQAAPFSPTYHLGQQVTKMEPSDKGWRVATSKGTVIHTTTVVIAAGCGAFGPNRPPLEGLSGYEASKAVQYMVGKREVLRGKKVVIAGGGDSAVDWALSLHDVAEKLYVVHRRAKFRAMPESVAQLHALVGAGKIELVVPYQLHGLKGDGSALDAVVVRDLKGNEKDLPADVLLPFYGLAMELGPIAEWGLQLDKQHIAVDPVTMQTNAKGVYAVGDMAHYPGKLKLILCGFSETAMACHAARELVYPDEVFHFEYSTTQGVPGEKQEMEAQS